MPSFTERQIEIANLVNSTGDIPAGTMDEILAIVEDAERRTMPAQLDKTETVDQIKMRIMNEPDWRKRAALSAMIISNSLA